MIAPIDSEPGRTSGGAPLRSTRALCAGFLDDEDRALLPSHVFSLALATCWLLVVHLHPGRELTVPVPRPPIEFRFIPNFPSRELPATTVGSVRPEARGARIARGRSEAANAFEEPARRRGIAGDLTSLLRNAAIAPGTGVVIDDAGTGRRATLGTGDGRGAVTPGRGGLSTGRGSTDAMGAVTARGGVERTRTMAVTPPAVSAPAVATPGRDISDVGRFVRAHAAQLASCYERAGRAADPSLAGAIHVAITVAGTGDVTDVRIARRTWSGPAAAAAEGCIRATVRGWHLPSSSESSGTYTFPFSFTRGR